MASCSDGEKQRQISHSDELLRLPFKPGNVSQAVLKTNLKISYLILRFSLKVANHGGFFFFVENSKLLITRESKEKCRVPSKIYKVETPSGSLQH